MITNEKIGFGLVPEQFVKKNGGNASENVELSNTRTRRVSDWLMELSGQRFAIIMAPGFAAHIRRNIAEIQEINSIVNRLNSGPNSLGTAHYLIGTDPMISNRKIIYVRVLIEGQTDSKSVTVVRKEMQDDEDVAGGLGQLEHGVWLLAIKVKRNTNFEIIGYMLRYLPGVDLTCPKSRPSKRGLYLNKLTYSNPYNGRRLKRVGFGVQKRYWPMDYCNGIVKAVELVLIDKDAERKSTNGS